MDFEGFSRTPGLRGRRWFHELPGDPYTVDGSAVAWPPTGEPADPAGVEHYDLLPVIIPAQRRSPEDW
jgi:hypothetical protein